MSHEAPPSTAPTPRRKLLERPKVIISGLTALVVLSGGVVTLVEKLSPGQPPAAPVAVISEPGATPGVALRAFMNTQPGRLNTFLAEAKAEGLGPAELQPVLRSEGVEASFTLELSGQVGASFEVTRNMFAVAGNVRVPEATTTVVPPPHYVLQGPHERFVDSTWIEDPPHPGKYYIELVVLDAHGEVLAHKPSGQFSVG